MPLTYRQAIDKARRKAKENARDYFVIQEDGEFHVTNDFDLDTFYLGISEDNILFCTGDD